MSEKFHQFKIAVNRFECFIFSRIFTMFLQLCLVLLFSIQYFTLLLVNEKAVPRHCNSLSFQFLPKHEFFFYLFIHSKKNYQFYLSLTITLIFFFRFIIQKSILICGSIRLCRGMENNLQESMKCIKHENERVRERERERTKCFEKVKIKIGKSIANPCYVGAKFIQKNSLYLGDKWQKENQTEDQIKTKLLFFARHTLIIIHRLIN